MNIVLLRRQVSIPAKYDGVRPLHRLQQPPTDNNPPLPTEDTLLEENYRICRPHAHEDGLRQRIRLQMIRSSDQVEKSVFFNTTVKT